MKNANPNEINAGGALMALNLVDAALIGDDVAHDTLWAHLDAILSNPATEASLTEVMTSATLTLASVAAGLANTAAAAGVDVQQLLATARLELNLLDPTDPRSTA